jgi:hypothetical protein
MVRTSSAVSAVPQIVLLFCLQLIATPPATARGPSGTADLLVPGGTARLLQVAGVRVAVEPDRALLATVRALYPAPPALVQAIRVHLAAAARAKGDADHVPALLPHAVWERAVFGEKTGADELAARILGDREAALLYYGLFSVDDETLAFLVDHPSLITAIYRHDAAPFAVFADAIAVRAGRITSPGGASSAAAWEALVGAPMADPEGFITRLLRRDQGRLAWLFATVARLDGAHQAFAIGRGGDDLKPLYVSFAGFDDGWRLFETPFRRWAAVDPAMILERIAVTPAGEMAPPRLRAFWQAVLENRRAAASLGAGTSATENAAEVTAAWLIDRFKAIPASSRRARLDSVLFGQRLFADAVRQHLPIDALADGVSEVLSAFPAHQALIVTLERMGLAEPLDYQQAVQAARKLTARFDPFQQSLRLATFQGALALVARLDAVGALSPGTARDLCRSLFPLASSDETSYPGEVARWIESALLARLPRKPAAAPDSAEDRLIEALAGASVEQPTPIIEWEGHSYRVDVARAEQTRLRRIRRKQGGCDLDGALELGRIILRMTGAAASSDGVRTEVSRLLELVPTLIAGDRPTLFGFEIGRTRDEMVARARQIGEGRGDPKSAATKRLLAAGLAVVLADVLASHVYATALGDPETPLLLAENPARRHDFALQAVSERGPWLVARVTRVGSASAASGSLLALERTFARYWLRPTTLASPVARPVLWEHEVQGLGESVAALNPFQLTDQGRDTLVGALRRGRDRLTDAALHGGDIDRLAETAGVEGWRRRLIRRAAAADPAAVAGYFSLGEVLGLGLAGPLPPDLDAWGLSMRVVDGSLEQRLPCRLDWDEMAGRPGRGLLSARVADLHLRVAESLAELKLPAALAPGILSYAMWDLAMSTQMIDEDDWLSVARAAQAVSTARMADHVSALTSDGPLVPVAR